MKKIWLLRKRFMMVVCICLFTFGILSSPVMASQINIPAPVGFGNVYTVVPGDTLYHIARVNGTHWRILADYNQISDPRLIFPGQQIRIPHPSPKAIEQQRIQQRFPHVSSVQEFISLDNGTLIDTRLFEAWTIQCPQENNFGEKDLKFIFDLIIRHVDYIDDGDEVGLRSTMIGQDGSDSNHFHPRIYDFMEKNKNSSLFVERIVLSSASFGIRIIISNYDNEEFHIWPHIDQNLPGYYSWRINRYSNHLSEEFWIREHNHLWEYVRPFHYSYR